LNTQLSSAPVTSRDVTGMWFCSVFEQAWDVVVFGGGYAGFAAARACSGRVLLVERRAALLTESGWAFATQTGESHAEPWQAWLAALAARGGVRDGIIDGAIAEVLASEECRRGPIAMLYYATPVAVEKNGSLLGSVVVGTKAGLRRVSARQWIDASETGELACLLDPGWDTEAPVRQVEHFHFRHAAWKPAVEGVIEACGIPGAHLHWQQGHWPNERRLSLTLPGEAAAPRHAWQSALRILHAARAGELAEAVMTHASVVPFVVRQGTPRAGARLPDNVVRPESVATLAGRFCAGLDAAATLRHRPQADIDLRVRPCHWPEDLPEDTVEVAVAGLGTGGALAALAAGRMGAAVLGFDPLPFAGGIGTGGGIHWYYFGVKGGLQEEVDDRVRQLMPLFGPLAQVYGFHPDAKKLALDELLGEAGVQLRFGTTLCGVKAASGRVTEALVSTPHGPRRIRAEMWVDGTGDGDLAAPAGAPYRLGRAGDGLLHAYSQSSGRTGVDQGLAKMVGVNFDAGFCDPTDVEDLTRARLVGLSHYIQQQYDQIERPTYIAPAIGLRQGRQIETDYRLTLDDLIEHRHFADTVGYTACHYDNHARDYEFESLDSLFWTWVCLQLFTGRTACAIPYRILLPKTLDNVWLACRALGVSEEAHHSVRMQRDMQRIGEVVGIAAVLAMRLHTTNRAVPFTVLREKLLASGAIPLRDLGEDSFGDTEPAGNFQGDNPLEDAVLKALHARSCSAVLWQVYHAGPAAASRMADMLADADDTVSWRAAVILAMWGDRRAESRLLQALRNREDIDRNRDIGDERQGWFCVPRWLPAISLLRKCGSVACLPDLLVLARDVTLVFTARTSVALACDAIIRRMDLNDAERCCAGEILDCLLATPAPQALRDPGRYVEANPLPTTTVAPGPAAPTARPEVLEDRTWQLHLAVLRARQALGLTILTDVSAFRGDTRALVRRAFAGTANEARDESR